MELHRCRGGGKWIWEGIRMDDGINGKGEWNYIDICRGGVSGYGKEIHMEGGMGHR